MCGALLAKLIVKLSAHANMIVDAANKSYLKNTQPMRASAGFVVFTEIPLTSAEMLNE